MDNKKYPDFEYCEPTFELAKAYVPYQVMSKIYEPSKALCKGTVFPELYKPYDYKKSYGKKRYK